MIRVYTSTVIDASPDTVELAERFVARLRSYLAPSDPPLL